jgi:hypothetical protein
MAHHRQGMAVAQKIGAKHYLECSAKTGEGVRQVFQFATRCSLVVPMSTPTKSRWSRVVRRASTIINTARPSTPERGSTSSDREDDTGSLRRFGRSRSNTSLSALQTSAPSSPPPQPPILPTQPSPIAESPAREAAALQALLPSLTVLLLALEGMQTVLRPNRTI